MPAERWQLASTGLDITQGALIGVVNTTPDSFSDGGISYDPHLAVAHGLQLIADGATRGRRRWRVNPTWSTRSEHGTRTAQGPARRPRPSSRGSDREHRHLQAVRSRGGCGGRGTGGKRRHRVPIGRHARAVAASACGVVVMHMQGTPKTMSDDPHYEDVVSEVEEFSLAGARRLHEVGVDLSRIALDPGFGSGKRPAHSLTLLSAIGHLADRGFPLMIGTSRKGFLGKYAYTDMHEDRDVAPPPSPPHSDTLEEHLYSGSTPSSFPVRPSL